MLNISKLKNITVKNSISTTGSLNNDIRHRPAFTKEWLNSIYNFNDVNTKTIPSLDLLATKIINNYFNMFYSRLEKSVLIDRKSLWRRRLKLNKLIVAKPEFKHTNDKLVITLYVYNRELSWLKQKMKSIRRIFLAEYYHRVVAKNLLTIKKVITLRALVEDLNNIKSSLKKLIKKIIVLKKNISGNSNNLIQKVTLLRIKLPNWVFTSKNLLSKKFNILVNKFTQKNIPFITKLNISIKKSFYTQIKLNKYIQKRIKSKLSFYYNSIRSLNTQLSTFKSQYSAYLHYLSKEHKNRRRMRRVKSLSRANKNLNTYKITKDISNIVKGLVLSIFGKSKSLSIKKYRIFEPKFNANKYIYYLELLRILHRMRLFMRYNRLIAFNKFKFNVFINPLKHFLEKIYKKNVEFNIITLKNYYLNSSILAKVISTKLRNKKNFASRIVSVISKVKMPVTRKIEYLSEIPRNKTLQNIIISNYLNKNFLLKKPIFSTNATIRLIKSKKNSLKIEKLNILAKNEDKLNMVLKSIYKPQYVVFLNKDDMTMVTKIRKYKNLVLDSIKNKVISGIKLEINGRLSKRATAARSLSTIKQKGTIKNINSSYKKIPTVLLRGNLKSNVQYTVLSDRTRIGSFGVKGWISSI